jgi:2'-hydroxybiphenyl-2-sulfinate desulfinase
MFVRPDSDIREAASLRGRKVAMTRNAIAVLRSLEGENYLGLGPWEQTQMALGSWEARGLINTLATANMTIADVEVVEVPNPWAAHTLKSAEESSSFAPKDLFPEPASPRGNRQVRALVEREVDAIFSFLPYSAQMELNGFGRLLLDLSKMPGNDYVSAWTASSALVESDPDAVQAVMQEVVETGKWAMDHRDEIVRSHAENLGVSEAAILKGFGEDFNRYLIPTLSADDLAGLERTQQFLVARNLLPQRVKLENWIEPRFLDRCNVSAGIESSSLN